MTLERRRVVFTIEAVCRVPADTRPEELDRQAAALAAVVDTAYEHHVGGLTVIWSWELEQ